MRDDEIIKLLDNFNKLIDAADYETLKITIENTKHNIMVSRDKSSEYVDKLVDELK